MPESNHAGEAYDEINVGEMLAELYRRKWLLIGITLIIGGLAAGYSLLLPNVYESSAALIIRDPQSGIGDETPTQELTVETLQALAESTDVKRELFETLWDDKALSDWQEEAPDKDTAFMQFQNMLSTEVRQRESRGSGGSISLLPLLVLKTRAKSPEEAKRMADGWAEIIVEKSQRLYTQGVGDLNEFIGEMYENADEKLRAGEDKLMELTLEADLDVKKAQFEKSRSKAIDLDADVFDLRVDIRTKKTLLEEIQGRADDREKDGMWLADWAEDAFSENPDQYTWDEDTPREAREILKRVKAIVEKENALLAFVTQSRLNAKENEAETLLEALGEANSQLSNQRLELFQSLREKENIEEMLAEQEVEGSWIGELLSEYHRQQFTAEAKGDKKEDGSEKPPVSPETQRIDQSIQNIVRRELALLKFQEESAIEFKRAQLELLESDLQEALQERTAAEKEIALVETRLAYLEPELENHPKKLTLDKAITDDALWQEYLSGEMGDDILTPLKTELLNPVHERLLNEVVNLTAERESLDEEINYLAVRETVLRDEIDELRQEVAYIAMEIKNREEAIAVQEDALEVMQESYKENRKRFEELIVENRKKQQAIEALEQGRDDIYDRYRTLEEEVSRIDLRIAAKQGDIENLRTDLEELEKDYRDERSQLQTLRLELVRLEQEKALKEELLGETTQQSESLQTEIAALERDLNLQEREVDKLEGVRASLATRAEQIALLTITAENASQTGTAILYNAQANPLKVDPNRKQIVLAAMVAALVLASFVVCSAQVIRKTL
ncbi:MAG: Wzz/FepE/Etk N-terminal domain-containing protein [Candidatus Hydrogenedentota bacterium]